MGLNLDNMPQKQRDMTLKQMGKEDVKLVRNRTGPKPPGIATPKSDLEGAVKSECNDLMEAMGLVFWRANTGAVKVETPGQKKRFIRFGPKGQADFLGLLPNGRFLAVETKRRHGGTQSDDQIEFEQMIIGSNGVYLLVHSASELVQKLQEVMG